MANKKTTSKRSRATAFVLRIELGDDAMQTYNDVARALRNTAQKVSDGRAYGKIMDVNGNSVGEFEFK
jgi:hypothetical protein